jgi:hypothetical protein
MDSKQQLKFEEITPVAPKGLGGLVRDHFANGRLFATVGAHGGLLDVGYWGEQHLGAKHFFKGNAETGWVKLFRVCVRIGEKRYYLTLNDTRLLPFGYVSHCEIDGVAFSHELLLLSDALVLRARVLNNPQSLPIQFEMVHQEACTAVGIANRTWDEFVFEPEQNALLVSCRDQSPPSEADIDVTGLAQQGLEKDPAENPSATTWIGLSCDAPLTVRRGYHRRSKYYLASNPIQGCDVAYVVVFGTDRKRLDARLTQLGKSVHRECEQLLDAYHERLQSRPQVDVGDPVLNSAFGQYPELINALKVSDHPGATRATASGYFVWGWDGMTPMIPCALANEPDYVADSLRFFQKTWNPVYGIPHTFTSTFGLSLKGPFPAQCQYIASLYHYVATTGDLELAREVWPVCKLLLERCRQDEVGNTGLVSGVALWPDFPEAMEEDGRDVSSMNNSLLYQGLRAAEYLASVLDEAEAAAEFADWARRLRTSFVEYLYDEEKGFFISSCSSTTLAPRKHYCSQAIYWITPFARELVSHAPERIAAFMDLHLRSEKCLLSLPHWDTAWMADGNQLGSSFPTSDYFYLNVHKLTGDDRALQAWLGDMRWFWSQHTVPEAFTPEAENEDELGPDNPGCKQLQAITCWYAGLTMGLAGMDVDHEGITFTPWGERPLEITNLKLRDTVLDLSITGTGNHLAAMTLDGETLSPGTRKVAWSDLAGKHARLEIVRTNQAPDHPVVVRADGLRLGQVRVAPGELRCAIAGDMSGELVLWSPTPPEVRIDGEILESTSGDACGTTIIPVAEAATVQVTVRTQLIGRERCES